MQFLWARRPPTTTSVCRPHQNTNTKIQTYPNTRILGSWHIARENVAILFTPAASFAHRTGVQLLTWRHFLRTIYRRELEPGPPPHGTDGSSDGSSSSPLPWRRRFYAWTCKQFTHAATLEPPGRIHVWTGLAWAPPEQTPSDTIPANWENSFKTPQWNILIRLSNDCLITINHH